MNILNILPCYNYLRRRNRNGGRNNSRCMPPGFSDFCFLVYDLCKGVDNVRKTNDEDP